MLKHKRSWGNEGIHGRGTPIKNTTNRYRQEDCIVRKMSPIFVEIICAKKAARYFHFFTLSKPADGTAARWVRNQLTEVGKWWAGDGAPFTTEFVGTLTPRDNVPYHNPDFP